MDLFPSYPVPVSTVISRVVREPTTECIVYTLYYLLNYIRSHSFMLHLNAIQILNNVIGMKILPAGNKTEVLVTTTLPTTTTGLYIFDLSYSLSTWLSARELVIVQFLVKGSQ